MEKKTRNIIIVVVIVCLIGVVFTYDSWDGWMAGSSLTPDEPTEETTFVGFDYVSGEEVSSHAHIEILGLKDTVENPSSDDIRTLTNYETLDAVNDIEDISVDLLLVPYYYIVVNPTGDQYWATHYQLEFGMKNIANKQITLYHQASDIDGTVLDASTMDEWDRTSDLTHGVIVIDVQHESALELHKGDGWETSTTEYDDLETVDQLFFQDQAKYRCEFPTYHPSLDSDKDGQDELEMVTNVFGIELIFNESVSLIDGAATQVNLTINDDSPIELAYSATAIYMLFTRVIDFKAGPYSINFDIALAINITCLTVKTCRVPTPHETSSLGTPEYLSTFPI